MSDVPFDGIDPKAFEKLRAAYRKTIPEKLDQMKKILDAMKNEISEENLSALRFIVHKTAGSAGSYGYPEVSSLCKEWEKRLAQALGSSNYELSILEYSEKYFKEVKQGFELNGK